VPSIWSSTWQPLTSVGEYWAVNQILAKQLHTVDDNIRNYTIHLMDKLEQTKVEYANEDALTDDAAGQAYVEQFAQETLDRAERVVKANKVTQQTATTFDAAATFFNLVNIWGAPDQETAQKIKYAKWNAARIAKAIREGKDPNESNPKHEQPQQPMLDPNDPEVQALSATPSGTTPRPVTVEEVPDAEAQRDAAGVSLPHSPASAGPSPSSDTELKLPGVPTGLGQPAGQAGYFDSDLMPSPVSPPTHDPVNYQAAPDLPPPAFSTGSQPQVGPSDPPAMTGWPQDQTQPDHAPSWASSQNHMPQPSAPPSAPPTFATSSFPTAAVASPPISPPTASYYTNRAPTAHSGLPTAPPVAQPASYGHSQATAIPVVDEAAIAEAQKHAKWAISALNFEDVPTAVRELRKALETLGAS